MKKNCQKGFTLIELLIGITLVSIVFSIGYASFREFSRRQLLSGVVKKVKSDLRTAQQLALSGQKPSTGTCTRLDGYTFTVTGSTTYQIAANCTGGGNTVIKTATLDTGVTLSSVVSATQFKVLGAGTDLSSDNTITFTLTAIGNTDTLIIGKGGDIK